MHLVNDVLSLCLPPRPHQPRKLQWIHHQTQQLVLSGVCPRLVFLMLNCRQILTMLAARASTAPQFNLVALVLNQTPLHHMLLMPWTCSINLLARIHGTVISLRQQRSHPAIQVNSPPLHHQPILNKKKFPPGHTNNTARVLVLVMLLRVFWKRKTFLKNIFKNMTASKLFPNLWYFLRF